MLITVQPAVYRGPEFRWGFRIIANTNNKGVMRATIEYCHYVDAESKKTIKKTIDDFSETELTRVACAIVDETTKEPDSKPWKVIFREVQYIALPTTESEEKRRPITVSMQSRTMRLSSSEFAPQPVTAEVRLGKRHKDLHETTANSLEIDDAYAALVTVQDHIAVGGYDDEDDGYILG